MGANKNRITSLGLVLGLILFILLVFYLVPLAITYFYGKPSGPGVFGDMFGGVNALFSGLVLVGVIYAILLQRRELELQRKELELTREEMKGQKLQLEAQNRTFRQQIAASILLELTI